MSWWMRCFISIDLPEDVKKELVKLQKKIDETGLIRGKLTEEENIHLTLKFLGEIDYDKIEEVKRRLKEIQLEKREAKLGELGVFSESYVRIIWVRLEGVDDLQKAVDSALEGVFKKEERLKSCRWTEKMHPNPGRWTEASILRLMRQQALDATRPRRRLGTRRTAREHP